MSTNRLRRTVGAAAAVLCIAAAIGPASAMAETAKFSPEGTMKWTGSIKIFANGGSEKTCTAPSTTAVVSGSAFQFASTMKMSCTGGTTLEWRPQGSAYFEAASGYHLNVEDYVAMPSYQSPYGTWHPQHVQVSWTNGAGSTQSTITFSNTVIGSYGNGSITATGTLTATTFAGGLLTLTH